MVARAATGATCCVTGAVMPVTGARSPGESASKRPGQRAGPPLCSRWARAGSGQAKVAGRPLGAPGANRPAAGARPIRADRANELPLAGCVVVAVVCPCRRDLFGPDTRTRTRSQPGAGLSRWPAPVPSCARLVSPFGSPGLAPARRLAKPGCWVAANWRPPLAAHHHLPAGPLCCAP